MGLHAMETKVSIFIDEEEIPYCCRSFEKYASRGIFLESRGGYVVHRQYNIYIRMIYCMFCGAKL